MCSTTASDLPSDMCDPSSDTWMRLLLGVQVVAEKWDVALRRDMDLKKRFVTYVHNVVLNSRYTGSVLCGAIVYMERAVARLGGHVPAEGSVYRIFTTAYIMSAQFIEDVSYKMKSWAMIIGHRFAIEDLNAMRLEFMPFIGYNLFIGRQDLVGCIARIPPLPPTVSTQLAPATHGTLTCRTHAPVEQPVPHPHP